MMTRYSFSMPMTYSYCPLSSGTDTMSENSTYYVCRRVHGAQLCSDVGANIGWYTVVMGRQAPDAEIIALEPNPVTYELLTANIKLNWLTPRCRALRKGASDKPETLR